MDIATNEASYVAAFNTKEYLAEFCAEPDEEFYFTIRFMIKVLRQLPSQLFTLEFGGGPTLHSVATLAPQAREIHFCDYTPSNLAAVQSWLDGAEDAFDWRPQIEIILKEEGTTATSERITDRIAEIRQKVTRLSRCNALSRHPLGEVREDYDLYDLVVAHHCTDVAAATVSEWMQVVKNVTTLVSPGGWLILSVSTGSTKNTVGSLVFNCVDLTAEDVHQGYVEAGYEPETFCFDSLKLPKKHEYSGVISAIARKMR